MNLERFDIDPEDGSPAGATEVERAVMAEIVRAAASAHEDRSRTGIVAAIVLDERLLVKAENHVDDHRDPTRHAEMVALSQAARMLGTTDLSRCTLLSTLQPCEMCLSAMRFSRIRRVIFAARQDNVAGKYFCFPRLSIEDFAAAGEPFEHVGGVLEADVIHLYAQGSE